MVYIVAVQTVTRNCQNDTCVQDHLKPSYYCVDPTFVKNLYGTEVLGRNPTDRGRKIRIQYGV